MEHKNYPLHKIPRAPFYFGQALLCRGKLERKEDWLTEDGKKCKWKVWSPKPIKTTTVIFLGWRSLRNGTVDTQFHDNFMSFNSKTVFSAMLVCKEGRNPFYCLAGQVEKVRTLFDLEERDKG